MEFDVFKTNVQLSQHGGDTPRFATTTGAVNAGDGGGGNWLFEPESMVTANFGTVIVGKGGKWIRQFSGSLDPRWWNARPNDKEFPHNSCRLIWAMDWARKLNIPLDFGGMNYHCHEEIHALTGSSYLVKKTEIGLSTDNPEDTVSRNRLVLHNGNISFAPNENVGFRLGRHGAYSSAEIKNFSIGRQDVQSDSPFAIGLHVKNTSLNADNLRIKRFGSFSVNPVQASDGGGIGLLLDSTTGARFTNSVFDYNMAGVVLISEIRNLLTPTVALKYVVIPANENKFWGCSLRFNTGAGVILMGHPHHTKELHALTKSVLHVNKGANTNGFSACWFEDNLGPGLLAQAAISTTITDCRFENNGTTNIELNPYQNGLIPPEIKAGISALYGEPPEPGVMMDSSLYGTRIALNFFASGNPAIRSLIKTYDAGTQQIFVGGTRFIGNYFAHNAADKAVELLPPYTDGEQDITGTSQYLPKDATTDRWKNFSIANLPALSESEDDT